MNILITGAGGFIGKNLAVTLRNQGFDKIFEYDTDTDPGLLDSFCERADFVFHLAGVNRPESDGEFMKGNFGFTLALLDILEKHGNTCPIMLSSSVQAALGNPYGRSKKAGEELLFKYAEKTGADALVYRLPNVFGKWCRPNYNSAVATFCHNIPRGLPIRVDDRAAAMSLVYIDDVAKELVNALRGNPCRGEDGFCHVPVVYETTLGRIVDLLYSFKGHRGDLGLPDLADEFTAKLYAAYLSYLPEDGFRYPLKMNTDARGSFTEIIRTPDRGQFSVNISKPGIIKGEHWHHTKNEKFLAVSGRGIVRFRKIGRCEIFEYPISGEKLEIVEIPPGYTHNIENTGDVDLVTVMWASEPFNPDRPDTISERVRI